LAKANYQEKTISVYEMNPSEKELVMNLSNFKEVISRAAETLSPALIANYIYEVVKSYNSFYQNNSILNQDDENVTDFRLELSALTARTIKKGLNLLGIGTVNRM
jgi:arginyl-tRNA synthetase